MSCSAYVVRTCTDHVVWIMRAGCGVTAGVLCMGLIAFRQACTHPPASSTRAQCRSETILREHPAMRSRQHHLPAEAVACHMQGNSALSQKMMRARVTAQVLLVQPASMKRILSMSIVMFHLLHAGSNSRADARQHLFRDSSCATGGATAEQGTPASFMTARRMYHNLTSKPGG